MLVGRLYKMLMLSFLLATLLLLSGGHEAYSAGLAVEPGGLLIQHLKPGERYDLEARSGLRLKIVNQSTQQRTFRIRVGGPEELGINRWTVGYSPIPDPGWFSVEPSELVLLPQGTGYAKMFVNIPADASYANQHWVVALAIQAQPGPGEALALALKPVYYLETESREGAVNLAADPLAISPTILKCLEVKRSKNQQLLCGELMIYNGDGRSHTYCISSALPEKEMTAGQKINPSPGFSWLANPSSVLVEPDRFALEPHQSRIATVQLNRLAAITNREALLWVRPDKGSARFVRLQIR